MNTATDTAIQAAAAIVEDYFTAPVRTLLDWVDPYAAEVFDARAAGPLTRSRIDALVEPHALRTLDLPGVPVYGAGFIAAIDLLSDAHSHLAWWQGEDRRQLVLASQSLNKENIDYSALEWFRVPMATGEPHVAGPYVDYLCSDEYTLTVSLPVWQGKRFLGVVAMDLLVDDVERELLPALREFGDVSVVNASQRVLASTETRLAPGDSVRNLAGYGSSECTIAGLRVLTRI